MKILKKLQQFQLLLCVSAASKPQPYRQIHQNRIICCSSSSSTIPNLTQTYLNTSTKPKTFSVPTTLTQEEACNVINLLIPRLCLSNRLTTAIQLTTAAVRLTTPKTLSLSILIHSLTLQPDMKLSISLLTRITRVPQAHSYIPPISTMLIASYIEKDKPKDALKVYTWMLRPASPCNSMVDKSAYGILVGGLCDSGLLVEGLRVLRDMLRVSNPVLLPGEGLRKKVVRSLLREARIEEAKAFEQQVFPCITGIAGAANKDKVLDMLDHIILEMAET